MFCAAKFLPIIFQVNEMSHRVILPAKEYVLFAESIKVSETCISCAVIISQWASIIAICTNAILSLAF